MSQKYNVAVVGATGMVGKVMLKVLEEENFPVGKLLPLASQRTAGQKVSFRGEEYTVEVAKPESFQDIKIALFSAGGKVSEILAPEAAKRGAIVIDNTSFFRMNPEVPLIVPEVNGHALKDHKGIIANPNCSTAQMLMALKPIYDAVGIERLVISTYQSTSGWGKEAVEELQNQTAQILKGETPQVNTSILPKQIAFNVIPEIDKFMENGYTKEEMKMVEETQKIFEDDSIAVTATCVRVPVMIGHAEAVNLKTKSKISVAEVRELLADFPTVKVLDDPGSHVYPTPIDSEGKNETLVGRIREDISQENGLELFIVSDNLRRGAAFNAVLIAKELIKRELL